MRKLLKDLYRFGARLFHIRDSAAGTLVASLILGSALILPLLVSFDAAARPGGGSSFSSSSRSSSSSSFSSSSFSSSFGGSSSGGSGGSSGGVGFLVLFILLKVGIWGTVIYFSFIRESSWSSLEKNDGEDEWSMAALQTTRPKAVDLSPLRETDPNFSQILLEDFIYGLYTRAQLARGRAGDMDLLAPYLARSVRKHLNTRNQRDTVSVSNVIVGGQTLSEVSWSDPARVTLTVLFESNYTEMIAGPDGKEFQSGFYAKERWLLTRKRSAASRPPDKLFVYNCPNCGGPVEKSQDERCAYCDAVYGYGEFDWFVTKVFFLNEEQRGPALLSSTVEQGTDSLTIVDDALGQNLAGLKHRDPAFAWDCFLGRVSMIFKIMQTAWSNLTWEDVRPYVTDRFFISQSSWIAEYAKQGLRNILTGARITNIEPAKVTTDPYFDAITLRIFGTGLDYTVRADSGEVVSGSQYNERRYSEYWTFIRSVNASGEPRVDKICPGCGAPIVLSQTGNCSHCGVKVTGGEFDWVLSRIEQDETYTG